ncbi:unnamed protein product [Hydatigera taeniaeformis]|uniref:Uncharacterized protein n=1 Tax=Hydatigena taeniaeformis TaxID=6205 RepID=A0A0R3WIF9_HYDTA|nr:unnamed protein product [Hydatigera taeniaeformis]
MAAPNIMSQSTDVLMQKKLNELAVYLERELDSKPKLECKHESAKICALNQRFSIDSSDGKPPEGKSLHHSPANRKTKHQTKKSVSSNESTPRSSIPVTFAQEEDVNSRLSRTANCCIGADFSNTGDAACHAGFLDMEEEINVLKVRNSELLERCRVLENDLCRTTDERDKLSGKMKRMFDAVAKVHEDVTAEKTRRVHLRVL